MPIACCPPKARHIQNDPCALRAVHPRQGTYKMTHAHCVLSTQGKTHTHTHTHTHSGYVNDCYSPATMVARTPLNVKFASYMVVSFITFFHILLFPFFIIVYMVVCFVCFCLILLIMYFYCYVYKFLLLYLCILIMYVLFCVLFHCCSVYCLCVNVYCTTAIGCQPNCSQQIYQCYVIRTLPVLYVLNT